jgi:hypothetical protein
VPDVALYATAKKLMRPSCSEGFHEIYRVRVTGNSTFEVRAWTDKTDACRDSCDQKGPGMPESGS